MKREFIKELKYRRMSPEERFLCDIFDGITSYNDQNRNNAVIYTKNGKPLFHYYVNNGDFFCNQELIYDSLCKILKDTCYNNEMQINDRIKFLLEKYLQINITHVIPDSNADLLTLL
jgi:hypothetical protein